MVIQADKINHASQLAVQDLAEDGRYMEVGGHDSMLLLMGKTQWIPHRYHQIKWDEVEVADVPCLDESKPSMDRP